MNLIKKEVTHFFNKRKVIASLDILRKKEKLFSKSYIDCEYAYVLYEAIMNEEYKLAGALINRGAKILCIYPETTNDFWRKLLSSEFVVKTLIKKYSINFDQYQDDIAYTTLTSQSCRIR